MVPRDLLVEKLVLRTHRLLRSEGVPGRAINDRRSICNNRDFPIGTKALKTLKRRPLSHHLLMRDRGIGIGIGIERKRCKDRQSMDRVLRLIDRNSSSNSSSNNSSNRRPILEGSR